MDLFIMMRCLVLNLVDVQSTTALGGSSYASKVGLIGSLPSLFIHLICLFFTFRSHSPSST